MKTFFQEFDHGFYRFPLSWGDVSQNARMAELVYSKALTYGLTLYQKFSSAYLFSLYYSSFIMLLKMVYVYLKTKESQLIHFLTIFSYSIPTKTIRKSLVLLCFQGYRKKSGTRKGLTAINCRST